MAHLIRVSEHAIRIIPEKERYVLHSMFEDSDLDGYYEAERLFDFLEAATPGVYVAASTNNSVHPPCVPEHYDCDHYDPYWTFVLMSSSTWQQYKEQVEQEDKVYKASFRCKQEEEA